jgi:hypothetical protein
MKLIAPSVVILALLLVVLIFALAYGLVFYVLI